MKKRYIVGIILSVLILIAIVSYFIVNLIIENGKKYEIAKVNEYNYFVLKQNNLTRCYR